MCFFWGFASFFVLDLEKAKKITGNFCFLSLPDKIK